MTDSSSASHFTPRVVILCGGLGMRMREETEFRPKPLVEIGGLPILWHIMKHYAHYDFNDFVLCLGYKGRMIKEFFMNYEWDAFDFSMRLSENHRTYHREHELEDWNITFANTGEKTMTGGRVKAIEKYIPKDHPYFLLTYGDGVSDVDLKKLIEFHERSGKLITLTGTHPRWRFGILELNERSEATNFSEKPPSEEFINSGFMVIDRRVLDLITQDGPLESETLPQLAKQGEVAVYQHTGFWQSMDTYKDFLDLNELWERGAPWKTWKHHPQRSHH